MKSNVIRLISNRAHIQICRRLAFLIVYIYFICVNVVGISFTQLIVCNKINASHTSPINLDGSQNDDYDHNNIKEKERIKWAGRQRNESNAKKHNSYTHTHNASSHRKSSFHEL